ncbi:MAG: hypothetical protein CVU39_22940 [Chloroflexi bacterium HGW-Chloroflexi-10]|nr:MAG: hypothetical protein CVU39_22940 [Chloroflexi bacterium HGW-Chloroflexi-10]
MPFVSTKFFQPIPRPNLVARQRLVQKLNQILADGRRLTLVCAPAGYGKTTVLAAWLGQLGAEWPHAWLSLDELDDSPQRFWAYLLSAIQRLEGIAASQTLDSSIQVLQNNSDTDLTALLTDVINALSTHSGHYLLVLDDLHSLQNQQIYETLSFFIEHLPPCLHLVIATRVDPPLPVVRLRARGQLGELRSADLIFSVAEAGDFLEHTLGLDLPAAAVQRLQEKTEGWPAGLQMAGLTLVEQESAQPGHAPGISADGQQRYILDYLFVEVLQRQSPAVQQVLLATAILNQFDASLARALTVVFDAQAAESVSPALLQTLENANLFLVPLDDHHSWYRYHHLFAELLRHHLERNHPQQVSALHNAAAAWFWEQWQRSDSGPEQRQYRWLEAAMQHALLGGDVATALTWFKATWQQAAHESQVPLVCSWLEKLPEQQVQTDLAINTAGSWIYWLSGRYYEAHTYLQRTFKILGVEPTPQGVADLPAEHAHILTLLSFFTMRSGEIANAFFFANRALETSMPDEHLGRGVSGFSLANLYRLDRQYTQSYDTFAQAYPHLILGKNYIAATSSVFYLAQIDLHRGHLARAEQTCRKALAEASNLQLEHLNNIGCIWLALGAVKLAQNHLEEAEDALQRALSKLRYTHMDDMKRVLYLNLWQLETLRGNLPAAQKALDLALEAAQRLDFVLLQLESGACQAIHWLENGEETRAYAWLQVIQLERILADPRHAEYYANLSAPAARILIHQRRYEPALQLLNAVLPVAAADERRYDQALLLLQRAALYLCTNQRELAVQDVQSAVSLSAPDQFVSLFLLCDPAVQKVLVTLQPQDAVQQLFVSQVLQAITREAPTPQRPSVDLVEPLTERELEILVLIARGYSNQQIADELYIALFTVKKHISNILGKLGASNRTQAIAKARSLSLL